MERGVRAVKPYVKEDVMNAFLITAVVVGLMTGICTVLNMRAVLRILMLIGFFLVWGRIEADPMQSVGLAVVMLVGAAIVIAPAQLLRRTPRRSYRIGSDVR